jgi:ubiquinone/menaquinone biosynthesis C-methylase UbiE
MYGYFGIQEKIGITKHMGGLKATKELLEMCRVDESDYVLVVGSGNGVSAIKIHRMTGCKVLGIDISEEMVERDREKREPNVEFLVGNAENLKFPHNTFDVVISESVTAFTNKNKSISEYYRVLKDGGYIGLNEVTWLINPSPQVRDFYQKLMGLKAETRNSWMSYLMEIGFKEVTSTVSTINQWQQLIGDLELQSMDFFRIWGRFFHLYLFEAEYRRAVHQLAWNALHIPSGFSRYFGYGLYTGRK